VPGWPKRKSQVKRKEEELMTELLYSPKIKPDHLARKAIVYLRQSSDKQVQQNKES
jgi:hypothetical protein